MRSFIVVILLLFSLPQNMLVRRVSLIISFRLPHQLIFLSLSLSLTLLRSLVGFLEEDLPEVSGEEVAAAASVGRRAGALAATAAAVAA